MEYIFECFFENTFDKITRNGLQDRSSRRDVLDHLNAVIGGCSDGQNMHTEEVARFAVLAAVRYHREKKSGNGDVCLMGKFHNILYIALRTCWDWGVRDSTVVVLLLEEIYSCEKTFERIFLGALFGPHAPHFIAGWRSDFRDQDENTRAMVYFLHHATSLSMQLPVWIARFEQERMVRFIDIPIESCGRSSPLRVALQASAPDLLLILLRYGAHPTPPDGGASVVHALLEKLTENGRNYVLQNVSCLQILLRTIPMIEMPYKPIIYSARRELFFEKYGRLLIDRIITKEQVYGVVSLRHLCRCRIRDLLRRNCQLPDGIDTLRLPRRLHRYIDLMEELEGPQKEDDDENNAALEKLQATGGAVSGARKRVHFAESKEEEQSSVDVEVAVEVVESLLLEERLPMEQQATMTGDLPTVVEEDTTELAEEQLEMESQNDFAVVVEKPLAVEIISPMQMLLTAENSSGNSISTDSDISSNEKAEQDSCICNNKKNGSNTLGKVRECIERQLS
uniref:SOCS box domain-containing protein n=1 Tax=Bactrocera latifrons TaxID=174628 RepID=A0A0K8UGK6_BACLA